MKKTILIILFALFTLNTNIAKADEVTTVRQSISSTLNEAVKLLKGYFSDTNNSINTNNESISEVSNKINILLNSTDNMQEINPKILTHGSTPLPKVDCDEKTQNLHWTGKKWECKAIELLTDCNAASDEYKVKKADGSYTCQKTAAGTSIKYYWKFTGYSPKCDLNTGENAKMYTCNYKNKQGIEVHVEDSHCSSTTKPNASNKVCVGDWVYSNWGSCSQSCSVGGKKGYQTRTATCPSGLICPKPKASLSQTCNNQICEVPWREGGWGSCSQSCSIGGKKGTQIRSVTCPSGYSCPGAKPTTSQACNNHTCTTHWRLGTWGDCNKSCGGGTQWRSVTCPAGYACPDAKPGNSQSCNTHACYGTWRTGSWSSCARQCTKKHGANSFYYECSTPSSKSRSVWCSTSKCNPNTKPSSRGSCGGGSNSGCQPAAGQTCGGRI